MNQYKLIKKFNSRLYSNQSPVTIEKYAFLYDSIKGMNMIQLKLRNISNKCISNMELGFQVLDAKGLVMEEFTHQFIAVNAKPDTMFGEQETIYLKSRNMEDVRFAIKRTDYDDGTSENNSSIFSPTGYPQDISSLGDYQDAYITAIKEDTNCLFVKNVVTENSGLWYCACGNIQKVQDKICRSCGGKLERILDYTDADYLKDKTEEIAKRQKEIKERNKKLVKTSLKICSIAVCFAVVILIGKFVYTKVSEQIEIRNRYQEAEAAIENHKYNKARRLFGSLGEYKDSKERKKEIDKLEEDYKNELAYKAAKKTMEAGEYEDAIEKFKDVIEYSDARKMVKECYYRWGKQLAADKEYAKAIKKLNSIKEYEDTEELLKQYKYEYAGVCVERKKIEEAVDLYTDLNEEQYKDSAELLSNAYYLVGCKEENKKHYDNAISYFEKVNGKDKNLAVSKIDECKELQIEKEKEDNYQAAKECASRGNFESALKKLESVPDDYEDTSVLKQKCQELINNKWVGTWNSDDASLYINVFYENEQEVYEVQYDSYLFENCTKTGNTIVVYSPDDNVNANISYSFNATRRSNADYSKEKSGTGGSGTATSINLDYFMSLKKISISFISDTQLQVERIIEETDIVYKTSKTRKEIEVYTKN